MKKVICTVVFLSLALAICPIRLSADGAVNWYIKRNGNEKPVLPKEHAVAEELGAYYIGKSDEKVIYLTFDAGYENGNVEKTLDILKAKGVPAAFFILKHLAVKNTDLVKRMSGEGHLVCNHTTRHADLTKLTAEEISRDLSILEDACRDVCGVEMAKYFRFPEGRYSKAALEAVNALGYKTVFWSFGYADWDNNGQPAAKRAYDLIIANTHPGEVILLHPTSKTNSEILARLIDTWRDMGYRFGTLDELTGM